jgi:hypothetical protein
VSSKPEEPPSFAGRRPYQHLSGGLIPGLATVLIAYLLLAGYLYHPIPLDGDGAAYALQALRGSPWERSVHVGYLAPLWLWTRVIGRDPALLSALWTGCALVLSTALGARLMHGVARERGEVDLPRWQRLAPLLAPLSMLAASSTWRSAGTVEVYGPLATLLLAATLALGSERRWLAGGLLAWALLVHPVAWALVPGAALLAGGDRRSTLQAVALAAVLQVVALSLLWPDWWSGGRGLLHTAPGDRGPWSSLQAGWRLLAGDLGPACVPLLAGLAFAGRRRLVGIGLVVLGSVLLLDRHSDNPGLLPALWLLCCFAPLAVCWLAELRSPALRRSAAAGAAALLLLGAAEATSRHDAQVRSAVRDAEQLLEGGCDQRALPWPEAMKLGLLCYPTPTPGSPR